MIKFLTQNTDYSTVLIIIFVIVIVAIIVVSIIARIIEEKIKKYSPYYNSVKSLNEKYNFNRLPENIDLFVTLKSKSQFDSYYYRPDKYYKHFQNEMYDRFSYYDNLVEKIKQNEDLLRNYNEEFRACISTNDETIAKQCMVSLQRMREKEKFLAEKIRKTANIKYSIRVVIKYTSPAGRNHYTNYKDYNERDIKLFISNYKNEIMKQLNTPKISKASTKIKTTTTSKTTGKTILDLEEIE